MVYTFCSRYGRNDARFSAGIEDDRTLDPRDNEVCSLPDNFILDSLEAIVDNGPVTSLYYTHTSQ